MQADYLIVGQGLCGSWLSWYLIQEGCSVIVVDDDGPYTASKIASGVINPVTGRRIVKTWMIDEVLPFVLEAYKAFGKDLGIPVVQQCNVIDFHPTKQMEEAFVTRMAEDGTYLHEANSEAWTEYFRFNYSLGEIAPCLLVDVQGMLACWRKKLDEMQALLPIRFEWKECNVENDRITYKDIIAKKVICCDGVAGMHHPYFNMLPYAITKGEAIIAEIPGLPRTNMYKLGLTIVPWKDSLFWIGASNDWNYADVRPTASFRKKVEDHLSYWLKLSFNVLDHWAAERPANIERRPFVGLHPVYHSVGILNGMGTKGCSLAPYFANQLALYLMYGKALNSAVDVKRFQNILSK